MRLRLADPPRPWQPRWQRVLQRIVGRWVICRAADPQKPGIRLNRYPHEVIGMVFFAGRPKKRQLYLSWVWPVWVEGVKLTREQFDRQARQVLEGERP